MLVSIIGTGNVATVLGKLLVSKKYQIHQVFGRDKNATKLLAKQLHASPIFEVNKLDTVADIYIIAVSDNSIQEVSNKINVGNKIIVHSAGAIDKNVLQYSSKNYGVLYPLQSIRKNMYLNTQIPFLIDANNKKTLTVIKKIATSLSKNIAVANDDQRLHLHIAAVFANNFVNYMYQISEAICKENKVDFKLLQPLIEETTNRLQQHHPKKVLTGPAIRKDFETIKKHQKALKKNKELLKLYNSITQSILKN